ncbi:GNAT family N-acetyltransferase [Litoreibacter janthinus]|uniref:Ribosomal protein S18 acetylase RimI n=1 Tax=Litoreibacter janthinus TaxID=670154 RepID=A0A1I6H1A1_9RHOB|nr:GNAT family N-acetyltransferase [Litoreibacter janthinus]SFR48218.1 Ribosomal protein S18 acetylase RimI [Litoreibacter janthinus]
MKTSLNHVRIRRLDDADLGAVAEVQLHSWRGTYADVLPRDYLGAPMERDIAQRWSAGLTECDLLFGAFDTSGKILGFAATRLGEEPYLDNLHMLEAARGGGASYLLMAHLADALAALGGHTLWLTVVDTNLRARAFYRRLGGVEGTAGSDQMFGQTVTSLPVRWEDLAELSKNARQVVSPLDEVDTGT